MSEDTSERVRTAVTATRAVGTARLRFVPPGYRLEVADALSDSLSSHGLPRLGATVERLAETVRDKKGRRGASDLPGPDGTIDFEHERCVYSNGTFWTLLTPGHEFTGEPGEWEEGPVDDLSSNNPFWLLAVLAATVEAKPKSTEFVLGSECVCYQGVANLDHVLHNASRPISVPPGWEDADVNRLPVQAWIDGEKRIRRATARMRESFTSLELSDFGRPPAISEPAAEELLRDP